MHPRTFLSVQRGDTIDKELGCDLSYSIFKPLSPEVSWDGDRLSSYRMKNKVISNLDEMMIITPF
jgi:hypothetical protein